MRRENLTDEQVEMEIARLQDSQAVKLAQKETRIKMKRRQYMYQLRILEKRGKELETIGVTFENIEEKLFGASVTDEDDE